MGLLAFCRSQISRLRDFLRYRHGRTHAYLWTKLLGFSQIIAYSNDLVTLNFDV